MPSSVARPSSVPIDLQCLISLGWQAIEDGCGRTDSCAKSTRMRENLRMQKNCRTWAVAF